jgi:hypothetical protein
MPASNDAGFDFGDGAIDYLNRATAVAAFVMVGPFQGGFGFAQMGQGSAHVGLIRANRLHPHRRDQRHQNQTCS